MALRAQRTAERETRRDRRIPTTRYDPDYRKGLTSRQVQEHRLHGWMNRSVEPPSKTTRDIVRENVFTYFNLIFVVLAVLLCLVGSFRDLTFLPVIIANTLIGIVQRSGQNRFSTSLLCSTPLTRLWSATGNGL